MALDDLRDFLDQPKLTLPIGRKKYLIEECSATTWLRLQANFDVLDALTKARNRVVELNEKDDAAPEDIAEASGALADVADKYEPIEDMDLAAMCLGQSVVDRMLSDGVKPSELTFAMTTAQLWQLRMHDLAERYWRTGGKVLTPPEPSEGQPPTATPTLTGAATTTRKRASRSTTTTPKKNSAAGPG